MSFAAEGVSCMRGERVVFEGVDFALTAGDALLLRGRNGTGKSSLLRLCGGYMRPLAGRLAWAGEEIAPNLDDHRLRIHYVGHLDPIKPVLTVREHLTFWGQMAGAPANIEGALRAFRLEELADLPARFLSAGQRRRLNLARLALYERPLWLLDEPANGLDEEAVADLQALLDKHCRTGGMAIVAAHGGLEIEGAAHLRLDGAGPTA
jgi:heme exporter protein A